MVTFPFYSRTKIAIFYKKRNRLSFFSYICSKDFECSILTKDTALRMTKVMGRLRRRSVACLFIYYSTIVV